MDSRKLGLGFGPLSPRVGIAEVLAPRKVTHFLDADEHERLVRGFGLREIAARFAS